VTRELTLRLATRCVLGILQIEEAWVTVLGVFNQLLIDPKGDYFVDVSYDD
jgi:hypothetical protein